MTRALAFLSAPRPLAYGARLSRLRWKKASGAAASCDVEPGTPAQDLLARAQAWVLVADPAAIPIGRVPEPPPGKIAIGRPAAPGDAAAHTLRELENLALAPGAGPTAAVAFRTADFVASDSETVELLFRRLQTLEGPAFAILAPDDPSDRERPEITRRLPAGSLRVLDAGCGAGGLALGKARNPGWEVVGIERNPVLAARARGRCARVLEGDLAQILPRLEAAGERFDAVVFADVLEHLEEPVAVLAQARRLAGKEGLLVVSVPNVGHLSIARDLVAGRFDPAPAGLCDAGHLRWFTRASLAEAIAEAGWRFEAIEAEAGAPAPDTGPFEALVSAWPDADRASLATYQWIATARTR